MKKTRVLHIVPFLDGGGIERLLLNYYKEMNHSKIQFDFIKHVETEGILEKKFKKLNSKIYSVPQKKQNFINYLRETYKIIKKNRYNIVHIHQNFMSWVPALICKLIGVDTTIIHSHNSLSETNYLKKVVNGIQSKMIISLSDYRFFCSIDAKKWLFGSTENSNEYFMENSISLSEFQFDRNQREKIRKELDIDNKIVIGQIGRISDQKNQLFTIDVLEEIIKLNDKFILILIGRGPLEKEVLNKIKEKNLEKYVLFLGVRNNVNEILQGIDIFMFPSKYEGLGIAALEAQALGIPCIVSDRVPKEVEQTGFVDFISLTLSPKIWAKKIIENKNNRGAFKGFFNENYDIKNSSKKLETFYRSLKND